MKKKITVMLLCACMSISVCTGVQAADFSSGDSDSKVEIEFQEEYGEWPCCKLFIQPFVENSILHGFEGRESGGMIRITGHIDGSRFRLCIEDNGCGMNEDTEKLMQQILMEKHTLDLAGTGIGIQNVVTRLRMYYGEELSVVLESEPEKGTKFTFWLPIPENPEKDIE